jgi:putative membrane protein
MEMTAAPVSARPPHAGPSSDVLAAERTRLAHERTMMAWIRTGTSLISFGFSIYKFADILEGKTVGRSILGPQAYGSAMIVTGLLTIIVAMVQHRTALQRMRAEGIPVPKSLATLVAAAIAILGILALGLVILHQ